jgi:hypothetical protein
MTTSALNPLGVGVYPGDDTGDEARGGVIKISNAHAAMLAGISGRTTVPGTFGTTTGSGGTTVVNDSTKSWAANQFAGQKLTFIGPIGSANAGYSGTIASNTSNSITLSGPINGAVNIPSGAQYEVAPVSVNVGSDGFATTTGGTSPNTLIDIAQSWTTNQWEGFRVTFLAGLYAGRSAIIDSNTSNTLTLGVSYPTAIAAGTPYVIGVAIFSSFMGVFVDGRDFQIDITGNNDSSVAINLAMSQAIAANLPVKLPPGIFALASVPVGYGVLPYQGGQFALFGTGGMGAQLVSGSNLPTPRGSQSLGFNTVNTVLINYTQNLPSIIANCVNGVWLKDIGLMGINVAPTPLGVPLDNYADYLSSGIRGGPSYPNSPYCAVAIDPLIKASPADGGYPGLTYANSFGSNLVLMENIPIQYFFVGVALSTSGAVAENGSGVVTRNVTIGCCDVAVAIGQSQSRLFTMTDGGIGSCRTAFDGMNYGNQQGCPPSRVIGANFGFLYRLFALPNAFGSCTFEKCYAESIRSLGLFGNGPSPGSSALAFEGGDWTISQNAGSPNWPPPPMLTLESYAATKFDKCEIGFSTQSSTNPVLNVIGGASPIVFDSAVIGAGGSSKIYPPFVGYNINMTSQVVMRESQAGGALLSDIFPRAYGIGAFASNKRLIADWNTRFVPDGATEYQYQPGGLFGNGLPEIGVTGVTNLTFNQNTWPTASTVTFNCTNYLAFQVGDILYWKAKQQPNSSEQYVVPALQVTSINSGTQLVTCALLFDPLSYDTVANYGGTTANMNIVPNQWAPTSSLAATCNGTTAVSLTGGASFYNLVQNGDWISDSAGHMPSYARVVSGSGTATLTLNIAATGSGATNLYFGRLYPLSLGTPI